MSQYTRIFQIPMPDLDDDYLESLQNIPSNFDLALNGGTSRSYLSANPTKEVDGSLLVPGAARRLSVSTISSMGLHSRGVSPYSDALTEPRTWKTVLKGFWYRNEGLFLVSVSQAFGSLMNVTTRLLELEANGLSPFQILFARQGITTILCCLYMYWKKVPSPWGVRGVRSLLVIRACTGFFGIFGVYYSLQYLPVADAVVITFLAPSVASYGCWLFLKEPFPKSAQYASLVSLLGVVLIARPTNLFSSSAPPTPEYSAGSNGTGAPAYDADFPVPTSSQRLSAVAVAMLGVLGSAGAFTAIRWIGSRAHPLISVNYFAVACTIISTLVLSLAQPLGLSNTLQFALPANTRQWLMLLFLGVCGFVMQILLTMGLAAGGRSNGARATNMIYTQMLFALSLDKLVFGQSPGWWSLAGSGLILGSAMYVALQNQRANGSTSAEQVSGVDEEGRTRNNNGLEVGTEDEEMAMLDVGEVPRDGGEDESQVEVELEEARGRS